MASDDDEEEKKKSDDEEGDGGDSGSSKSSSGKDQGQPKDSGPNNDTKDQGGQDQGGPQFSDEAQQGRREEGGGGGNKSNSGKDRGQPKDSGPNNETQDQSGQDQGGPEFSPEAQQDQGNNDPYGYESSSNDPGGFYRNPPPGLNNDPYNYESSSNDPSSFYRDPGYQYGSYQGPPQDTGNEQRLQEELQQAYQFTRQQAPPENLAPESNVQQYAYRAYDPIADMVRSGVQNFGYQPSYDPATGQTIEITRPETLSTPPVAPLQNGPLTTQAGVPGAPLQNGPLVATPAPAPAPGPAAPVEPSATATQGPALSPEATAAAPTAPAQPAPVAAATPTTPAQVAGGMPAYGGPTDQQTLAGQSPVSQGSFRDVYGVNAGKAWTIEHNEELKNIALYGAAKPPPNAPAAPTAPAGIPPYRGPDPAVTKMLDTFRVTPPVPAAGPGAPAQPGGPVVPTPQTGVAAASAAAPGAAPVTPGSPVLPTTGTPGAPVAGGVVGLAQAADGREVPTVNSVIGKVVNQQPLDAVTLAAGQAKADGTPIEGARDQIATEIANETERGDRFLTPIAQIAWYKENLVRDASFRQRPEDAPPAYIDSWKGMWRAGQVAPMTTALAAGLIDAGEKPPWVTRPERTLAANNKKVDDAIRGIPAPGEADTRPAGATPPGRAPTGIIPMPLKPAPITDKERAEAVARRDDASNYGPTNPAAAGVGQDPGSGFAGQGITATTNPATSGIGMPAGSGFAGQAQAIDRGPDTRPLRPDEIQDIYNARPPAPQPPAASTAPAAATVSGGLITQAAPTPGGVLEPEQPRSVARGVVRGTPLDTPNRGETAVANAGPGGAPPANLNPAPPAGGITQSPNRLTVNEGRIGQVEGAPSTDRPWEDSAREIDRLTANPVAGVLGAGITAAGRGATDVATNQINRIGTASDAERYGTGAVNEDRGTPPPTADPADISSVQGTPSSADRYQTGEEVIPPRFPLYTGPQVAPVDQGTGQGDLTSANRPSTATGEEVIPPRVPTRGGDISVQPTLSAADQPTTGEGAISPQVPSQYDPLRIRTSDTAGLAQRMLDQMDASIAAQAQPAQAGPSVAPSVAARTPAGAEDTSAAPGTATNLVPSANPSLILTAAQKRDTVLGITASTLDALQQGRTEVQQTSPEYERVLATAMAKLAVSPDDPGAQWAKPALDQVARLAWSRQAGQSPEEAPQSYVDAWKVSFKAGDDVPLVDALSDDMRRAGVVPPNAMPSPLAWIEKYGQGELGRGGLAINQGAYTGARFENRAITPGEIGAICGVVSAASLARVYGKDLDTQGVMDLLADAKANKDWTLADGMTVASRSELNILARMGINAKQVDGMDVGLIQSELAAGRPVSLNTAGHVWTLTDYDPQTGKYNAGGSGVAVAKKAWFSEGELRTVQGTPYYTVYLDPADIAAKTGQPGKTTPQAPAVQPAAAPTTVQAQRTPEEQNAAVNSEIRGGTDTRPVYDEGTVRSIQKQLMEEAPDVPVPTPGTSEAERMRQWQPTLDWLEKRTGVDSATIAGLAAAENGFGAASSKAVSQGNNYFSMETNPNDRYATGVIPAGRWASYPTPKASLARFFGVISHPENSYVDAWRNRSTFKGITDGLVKGGYINPRESNVPEWLGNMNAGRQRYLKAIGRA